MQGRLGTYQLTAARAGPWPVSARLELPALASNTRASGRAVASNTRERAVEQSQVTHASEHSRELTTRARGRALASNTRARGGALASTRRKCASDRARTRECKPSHSRVNRSRVLTYLCAVLYPSCYLRKMKRCENAERLSDDCQT